MYKCKYKNRVEELRGQGSGNLGGVLHVEHSCRIRFMEQNQHVWVYVNFKTLQQLVYHQAATEGDSFMNYKLQPSCYNRYNVTLHLPVYRFKKPRPLY